MKIVFICGSLEPGRDGVGDYTRRLACELIRQGHEARIIALNDKHIQSSWKGRQSDENTDIQVIRLYALEHWKKRMQTAKDFIQSFQPEWISLQYVPYAFHNKGLPFGFAQKLKRINGSVKWHIMFHELWVGMDEKASLQYRVLGYTQRLLIKRMIQLLSPKVIHSQTTLYQQLLTKMGQTALLLPLFSNIPVCQCSEKKREEKPQSLSLLFFGSIHSGVLVRDFLKELSSVQMQPKTKIGITFIGSHKNEIKHWVDECNELNIPLKLMGEQSPQIISQTLENASFGISTTPITLLEKSGSVAAMLEHNLPVICIATDWQPRYPFEHNLPDHIYEYKKGNLNEVLRYAKPLSSSISLHKTVTKFLKDIQ